MINNNWIVLFGPPGVGKSSIGKKLEEQGYHYYEGDNDLFEEVKELNRRGLGLSEVQRIKQNTHICERICSLTKYKKFVAVYDFMWDRYRTLLRGMCPDLRWIYLQTDKQVLFDRLRLRKGHLIDSNFALSILKRFEPPSFDVEIVHNDGTLDLVVKKIVE